MVKLPSLVAQMRQRTAPLSVPPRVDKTEFDSDESYKSYMKDRRKAQERLREFNRPHRVRQAPAARSTAGAQQLSKAVEEVRKRERRIFWGVNVATGRKQAPCTESFAKEAAQRKARRGKPDLQRAEYEESANDLPKITTAVKLHAALQQTEEHSDVTLSQVRRAVTEANKREQPEAVEEERRIRRSIQRGLSGTQPAAYAATLERKRKAREARRPEAEARAAERAQKRAHCT